MPAEEIGVPTADTLHAFHTASFHEGRKRHEDNNALLVFTETLKKSDLWMDSDCVQVQSFRNNQRPRIFAVLGVNH